MPAGIICLPLRIMAQAIISRQWMRRRRPVRWIQATNSIVNCMRNCKEAGRAISRCRHRLVVQVISVVICCYAICALVEAACAILYYAVRVETLFLLWHPLLVSLVNISIITSCLSEKKSLRYRKLLFIKGQSLPSSHTKLITALFHRMVCLSLPDISLIHRDSLTRVSLAALVFFTYYYTQRVYHLM